MTRYHCSDLRKVVETQKFYSVFPFKMNPFKFKLLNVRLDILYLSFLFLFMGIFTDKLNDS